MELYIPPPSAFLPRLPPPRPVVPAVPVVPIPDLPEELYAPEGKYVLNNSLFCSIGTPAAPLAFDIRAAPPAASFIGGAGGFIVSPPAPGQSTVQAGQTAMSFGSTVVNGLTHPAWPVKMSWVTVYFPPKGTTGGLSKEEAAAQMSGYEPSETSDHSSGPSTTEPPPGVEMPPGPASSGGKRIPFSKSVSQPSILPRPKNNLRSSNSTFVTRLQAMDNLPKVIAAKGTGGGEMVRWGFWNLGRTFGWGEEGGKIKASW